MSCAMVLGAGGLLGSEVAGVWAKRFGPPLPLGAPIDWRDPRDVSNRVRSAIDSLRHVDHPTVVVFWCAGPGHVASPETDLAITTAAFEATLDGLTSAIDRGVRVHLSYASSAGAVWAGAQAMPVTETTPVAPIHSYGRAKLVEEDLADRWATAHGQSVTLGRISNLFGENQNPAKRQGLVTKLVAGSLNGEPIELFVPLDTSRDFLPARTAAAMIVADAIEALAADRPETSVRIIAAGQSYTIAQVCGILQRLRRRRVPMIHVAPRPGQRQPLRLSFRTSRPLPHITVPTLEESLQQMCALEARRAAVAT